MKTILLLSLAMCGCSLVGGKSGGNDAPPATASSGGQCDLIVDNINGRVTTSHAVEVVIRIKNTSYNNSSGSFTLRVYNSENVNKYQTVSESILAGAVWYSQRFTFYPSVATDTIYAEADFYQNIAETNEGNNVASQSFAIIVSPKATN